MPDVPYKYNDKIAEGSLKWHAIRQYNGLATASVVLLLHVQLNCYFVVSSCDYAFFCNGRAKCRKQENTKNGDLIMFSTFCLFAPKMLPFNIVHVSGWRLSRWANMTLEYLQWILSTSVIRSTPLCGKNIMNQRYGLCMYSLNGHFQNQFVCMGWDSVQFVNNQVLFLMPKRRWFYITS